MIQWEKIHRHKSRMPKNVQHKRETRLEEILRLSRERERINARLDELMGLGDASTIETTPYPEGFSLMREVQALFKEKKQMRPIQAVKMLQAKFPNLTFSRRRVHSTLTYLARKGVLTKGSDFGVFILKE